MFHQCPQSSLPIILKVSLCWDPVPITWLVLKRNNSQFFSIPHRMFSCQIVCIQHLRKLYLKCCSLLCIFSKETELYLEQAAGNLLQGPPGSLPQGTKGDQQRKKGTCKQTQNFCPNVLMPTRILQAASKFFWEFIGKYISVLRCIDSEQHTRAELQHIWNNCLGFDSIITLMRKVSCLY